MRNISFKSVTMFGKGSRVDNFASNIVSSEGFELVSSDDQVWERVETQRPVEVPVDGTHVEG